MKALNLPFSASAPSFLKVKNCDRDNQRYCAKISQVLSLWLKILTTLPKYVNNTTGRKRADKYVK